MDGAEVGHVLSTLAGAANLILIEDYHLLSIRDECYRGRLQLL
jgi:hypothetical protein